MPSQPLIQSYPSGLFISVCTETTFDMKHLGGNISLAGTRALFSVLSESRHILMRIHRYRNLSWQLAVGDFPSFYGILCTEELVP
jgi:hypothetical protein